MKETRWIGLALALLMAGAAAGLGGARWTRAQARLPEGAFVVGADGTRWVVGGGARYRITFANDDAGQLASLREGTTAVATIAEAQAALAVVAAAPMPAAPAAQPPANPAETLVGQRVTACNYDADLDIRVVRAEWTRTVAGATAPGNTMWIALIIDVTNVSDKTEALTTRPLQLRDTLGRAFDVQEDPPDPADVASAYGVNSPWYEFVPGVTARSVVTFQVPGDVGSLTLVGKRDFC